MASIEQPKKSPTGYFLFLSENREAIEKELGTKKGSEVSKKGGEMWKAASEDVRKPYEEKAAKLKAEYDTAMQAFKEDGGIVSRKSKKCKDEKSKKAKKDPDAPKRPAGGGYGVYINEHREEITKTLPAGHKMTDVAKVAGVRWKALSDAERKVYEDKYIAKKDEFDKAMVEYKANNPVEQPVQSPLGKFAKKRSVDESEKKAARPKKARVSKGESKQDEIEIDEAVLAQARKVSMEAALKNLAKRSEIVALGLPSEKLLSTLQASNGLVNAAKHALLGA